MKNHSQTTSSEALSQINEIILSALTKGIIPWRLTSEPVILKSNISRADTSSSSIEDRLIGGLNRLLLRCIRQNEIWASRTDWEAAGYKVSSESACPQYRERTVSKIVSVVNKHTGEENDVPVWRTIVEGENELFHSSMLLNHLSLKVPSAVQVSVSKADAKTISDRVFANALKSDSSNGLSIVRPADGTHQLTTGKAIIQSEYIKAIMQADIRSDIRWLFLKMNPRPMYYPLYAESLYSARYDTVYMTSRLRFESEEAFWLEVLRLTTLATGHPLRLNRFPSRKMSFWSGNTDWRCIRERLIGEIVCWRLAERYRLSDALENRVVCEFGLPMEKRYFLTPDEWATMIERDQQLVWYASREAELVIEYMEKILARRDTQSQAGDETQVAGTQEPESASISAVSGQATSARVVRLVSIEAQPVAEPKSLSIALSKPVAQLQAKPTSVSCNSEASAETPANGQNMLEVNMFSDLWFQRNIEAVEKRKRQKANGKTSAVLRHLS